MEKLDKSYWQERYDLGKDGWDIGAPSTPLRQFIDGLRDRDLRILIPGCGRAWEGEYLHQLGFRHVVLLDLTGAPFSDLLQRCPTFPKQHLITGDFFAHQGRYDLIIEQTFFCAIDPGFRQRYIAHMRRLLVPGGRLVGVLFDDPQPGPTAEGPPFGGSRAEYERMFRPHFPDVRIVPCHNSIPPRAGREVWIDAPRGAD